MSLTASESSQCVGRSATQDSVILLLGKESSTSKNLHAFSMSGLYWGVS